MAGAFIKRSERNVLIAIAVDVADVHRQPATGPAGGEGVGGKFQGRILSQQHKTFIGRYTWSAEKGDGGNVEVAVAVKVRRHRAVRAELREEKGFRKIIVAVVEV